MVLTLIGYWQPGEPNEGRWPIVADFVDPDWSPDEREAVLEFLESGIEVQGFRGYSLCRLCGQHNGSTELSDGLFLWPVGLAHYVREHHVRLPRRAVARALERPEVDRDQIQALGDDPEVETEWWRDQEPDWQ